MIESISAVTLATHNMPHAVRFYRVLGFEVVHGDDNASDASPKFASSTGNARLTETLRRRASNGSPALTPLVANESEDGESQINFMAAHANHHAVRFVA